MCEGVIKKKLKEKLTYEHIKEVFLRKIPPCGIVCCFITSKKNEKGIKEHVFKYMDKKEFSITSH